MKESIWIGFDPREAAAFAVARHSIKRHLSRHIPIHGLVLSELQEMGLYTRPIAYRASAADGSIMWDTISDAPMSTQFAVSRFLVPHLAGEGVALFMDGDVLARTDLAQLFDALDPKFAVHCVKHEHKPALFTKMDGQPQTSYARKNWSSVMAFNCDHAANLALTLDAVNGWPGRDLHAFKWLEVEDVIGALDPSWNYLVGYSDHMIDPRVVHFTSGTPDMRGYENCEFAEDWRKELRHWAA